MSNRLKIGIIGAGGVGLTCVAFMSQTSDVVVKTRREVQAEALNADGITLTQDGHTRKVTGFRATSDLSDLSDCAAIIITVKSYDTADVIKELNPVISETTELVTIQNGLEALEVLKNEAAHPEQVFGGLTYVGANRTDDTSVLLGTLTKTVVDAGASKACQALADSEYDFKASDNVRQAIWDKMVLNTGQNALGALTGLKLGEMGESEYCLEVGSKLLEEFEKIAKLEGVEFDYSLMESLKKNWDGSQHHPSMWQDLQAGKRTEIVAINGAIVALAGKYGIEVPYNKMITALIQAVE